MSMNFLLQPDTDLLVVMILLQIAGLTAKLKTQTHTTGRCGFLTQALNKAA